MRACIAIAWLVFSVSMAAVGHAEDSLRPEVGTPLLAAQQLMKAQHYKEALDKVREAEGVAGRTPYENFTIERMRAAAASAAGDYETAAKSIESLIASGKLTADEKLKMMEALAGAYYRARDFSHAASWLRQYQVSGGSDAQMRTLLVQSLYFSEDYAAAASEIAASIADDERNGRVPPESMLQLLANCQSKTHDVQGYIGTLERLVEHYPRKEYWTDLIYRVRNKPGFPSRLDLDVYRLRRASGTLNESASYMEYAELALQAGFPAEARTIVDEGFQKKVLGTGADAARHRRLRDLAARQAGMDSGLPRHGTGNVNADGLVNDGYALVTQGKFNQGIALMEQGLGKDQQLKHSGDAHLHLALGYLQAGNKERSMQILKSLAASSDGTSDLARLWLLLTRVN
jgi:hypothetical protein